MHRLLNSLGLLVYVPFAARTGPESIAQGLYVFSADRARDQIKDEGRAPTPIPISPSVTSVRCLFRFACYSPTDLGVSDSKFRIALTFRIFCLTSSPELILIAQEGWMLGAGLPGQSDGQSDIVD